MPIAPLLQAFVADELSRAGGLIDRTAAAALHVLRHAKDDGRMVSERSDHAALVEALQGHSDAYRVTFVDALRRAVSRELQTQDGGSTAADLGSAGLELLDESRVEIDIEIARALQVIQTTAEWELRELQTFTSTLCGQQHVSAESNPLRPLVYAGALWDATGAVTPIRGQRTTLLRVSASALAGLLKHDWAAASSRLEAQGVQPGIYRTVLLAPESTPEHTPESDVTQRGAMKSLLKSMPDGGLPGTATLTPTQRFTPEFEHALLRLDEVLRDPPPSAAPQTDRRVASQRAALASSAASGSDRQVVELLSRVFALIQADTDLPGGIRSVLARLQVSALRVALHDPAMLESHTHPVWLLLDRIGEASRLYCLADDRRLVALQAFCAAIAEEVTRNPDADSVMFRRELVRLAAFLAEQVQWQLREAQRAVGALRHAEQRDVLEERLSRRLAERLSNLHTSPVIRRFVTGTWAKVLAESMLRHGETTEPTPTCVRTVDDLLWSLDTPSQPRSRQRLVSLLPGLLQRLQSGMAMIDLPHAEQQAVLDELMAVHTEALRPAAHQIGAVPTAAEIVQQLRDEVVPRTPLRPFSDSVVDLGAADTVPAEVITAHVAGVDPGPRQLDALVAGERRRLFLQGRWMRAQLLWRSDQGRYFLFAGETPGRTHAVTHHALERLDAAGLVQPLETKPLVRRTLDALLNQLALPV
jgi:hypothetical protein